ncbi:hypothetical protein D9758_014851 [Tetrapyrgos nigripes]|uniref:Uncharacterized protein n=1 Tax=Tetrapyrgos nigripes TaxID=182062 RepID=A0A8H5CTA5_9AGAR|nr:hypothetical protein D9758_014851 [Tetrapyrgos nigripes]
MQFNFAFVAVALLASASPAMSATLQWYAGAGCTGTVVATSNGASSGQCIWLTQGGSVKSIQYSGVPKDISFFISGGAHDQCTNGSSLTRSGSGCATAPTGVNWESVKLS